MALTAKLQERGRMLFKFADLLEKHMEELSQLETLVSRPRRDRAANGIAL